MVGVKKVKNNYISCQARLCRLNHALTPLHNIRHILKVDPCSANDSRDNTLELLRHARKLEELVLAGISLGAGYVRGLTFCSSPTDMAEVVCARNAAAS
jgi:hypothetical protein